MLDKNDTLDCNLKPNDQNERPGTILIVDDNSDVVKMIVLTLLRLGYPCVESASGGKEALEVAMRIHPDLVIMDIDMPEMDGVETAQRLAVIHPCPIIFSTGLCDKRTMERAKRLAHVSYLLKPFSPNELQSAIYRSELMSMK